MEATHSTHNHHHGGRHNHLPTRIMPACADVELLVKPQTIHHWGKETDTDVALAVVVVFMACAVYKKRVNPRCTAFVTFASTRRRVGGSSNQPKRRSPASASLQQGASKRRHPLRARPASDTLQPRNLRFPRFWIRRCRTRRLLADSAVASPRLKR